MSRRAAAGATVRASVTIRLSTDGKLLAFPWRMRLAEGMRIERWDPGDTATAMACYEVFLAAHAADEPIEPPVSAGIFHTMLVKGHQRTPAETWVAAPGADGAIAGFYQLTLPDLENKGRAFLLPYVHPAARRHGIGRALVRHAAARAAAHGRSFIDGVALAGQAGDAFAAAMGATLAIEEVRRVQDLRKIPPGLVASLRETAARAAAGYSLVTWTGPVPDEYLGQVAGIYNAFGDAPRGEGHEASVWDADRIRARAGVLLQAGYLRGYAVAAIADATGEMAALTEMAVDPEHPEWAFQQLTAVTRAHRGHRLGLLVKAVMLEWLASAEPRAERIATGNAASNEHMIAINEALGYEVAEPGYRHCELAVARVEAAP
jgi:GNAT superfamily N-acetyltransferase